MGSAPFKELIDGLEHSINFIETLREEDGSSAYPSVGFRNDCKHLIKLTRSAHNFANKMKTKHKLK